MAALLAAECAMVTEAGAVQMNRPAAVGAGEVEQAGRLEAADEASALLTARLRGRRVEILSERTEFATVWARPDGTVALEQSAGPLRFKDGARWRDIDTDLAVDGSGVVGPKAHPLAVKLAGGGRAKATELFSLGPGSSRVAQRWPGVLPKPQLRGSKAVYQSVRPGLDLVVDVSRTGLEESFIVHSASAARELESLELPLGGDEVRVKADPDGGLDLLDERGRQLGELGEAIAWDSEMTARSKDPEDVEEVETRIEVAGGGAELRFDLDEGFVKDADTEYPVTVDPALNFGPAFDAFVQQGYTSDQARAKELKWGNNGSRQVARSLLSFNAATARGKQIIKADLKLFNRHSWSCQARAWDVWSTGKSDSTARWTKQPTWVKKYVTSTETRGPAGCGADWITANVTDLVKDYAAGKEALLYAGVRAPNESDPFFWKRVDSAEGERPPVLAVTYNRPPATPVKPDVVPVRVDKTGRSWTTSTTPTATVTPTDPDGGQLTVAWAVNKDGARYLDATTKGASGTRQSWKVPAGKFQEGVTYAIYARVNDGHGWTRWSPGHWVTVLTAKPPAPSVTSRDFPPNTWGGAADGKGNFTGEFTATPSGAHRESVLWRVDSQPWKEIVTTTAKPIKVTVPPGPHTLQVKTRNRAGLESSVTSYRFLAGAGAALKAPGQGERTARRTALDAVGSPTDTHVRYQWRRGTSDGWKDVQLADVRWARDGKPVAGWPIDAPNGVPAGLTWNIADTVGDNGTVDVRAVFSAGTSSRHTPEHEITLDRDAGQAPAEDIGPGSVNLLTGNFTLAETDAMVWDMSVNRTLGSRRARAEARAQGVASIFGPGWLTSTTSEISESDYTGIRKTSATSVEIDLADEDGVAGISFTALPDGAWEPEPGAEDLTLTGSLSGSFTLTDTDGMVTTFLRTDGTGAWQVASSYLPEANSTVRHTWTKTRVGNKDLARPRYVIAPTSAASQAACETAPATKGCRVLEYVYATTTTASDSQLGDVAGQVKQIRLWATNPGAAAATAQSVAAYAYDQHGMLREQWDPRITPAIKTRYTYDTQGRVETHQTGTDQPWTMVYGQDGGGKHTADGALLAVKRPTLTPGSRTETNGTAQTSVVYGVPLTGDAAPHPMGHHDVNTWGQSDAPTDATALFPADQIPASHNGTDLDAGDYRRATLSYINASGRLVNTANPAGGITTHQYDHHGNTTWILTAANRALALGQGHDADGRLSELQITGAAPDERAGLLATSSVFSADGLRETDTREPLQMLALEKPLRVGGDTVVEPGSRVPARTWVHREFDQGRPANGSAKAKDLVTTQRTAAEIPAHPGAAADVRTVTTAYDWSKGLPASTVTDPGGLALTETTAYDTQGRVTKTTRPASNGNDAGTTLTTYWAATGTGECAGRPEWADLTCKVTAGASADQGEQRELPVTLTEYSREGQPTRTTDRANGATRTTTRTYDTAGRLTRTEISGGVGTPIRPMATEYDPGTGRATTQRFTDGASLISSYDTLGRVISYTDAHGAVTTTQHDELDRPTKITDPTGTRTLTYDHEQEPRGLLTSVTDTAVGTLTGRYDLDNGLVEQQLPGDVTVTDTSDTTGETVNRTVTRGAEAGTTTLVSDQQTSNAHGEWTRRTNQNGEHRYVYDAAGRLIGHDDFDGAGICSRTAYGLDRNSNRVTQSVQRSDSAGTPCGQGIKTQLSRTYDSAARLHAPGYRYDAFGRTTHTAEGASLEVGAETGYYTNDLVQQQTSGDQRSTWSLDPAHRRDTATRTQRHANTWIPAGIQTDHFGDDSDNPAWTDNADGTRTRHITDLAGDLIAAHTGTSTEWQFADLHADVTTTVTSDNDGRIHRYDPFGNPMGTGTAAAPYGYVGAKQRSNSTSSGQILMGARLYNPATGRFLQTDPVPGGSANNYDYVRHSPLNYTDLDGRFLKRLFRRAPKINVRGAWRSVTSRMRSSLGGRAIRQARNFASRNWRKGAVGAQRAKSWFSPQGRHRRVKASSYLARKGWDYATTWNATPGARAAMVVGGWLVGRIRRR